MVSQGQPIEDLLRKGLADEAMNIINEELVINPDDLQLRVYYGRVKMMKGALDEAELIFKSVLVKNNLHVDANLSLGKMYMIRKMWDDAEKQLELVLRLDSRNFAALANIAKIYLTRDGNLLKSKEYLLKAREINEKDERIHFDLGMIFFYNGEDMAGKRSFDEAEALNQNIDHKLIARVYIHYQHFDWAVASLDKHLDRVFNSGLPHDSEAELLLAGSL